MIGANLQYFGSSQIVQPNMPPAAIAQVVQIQGSTEIPSQTYLDLNLVWRPRIRASSPLSELTLEAGLVNALDKEPPRVSSALIVEPASAYSLYGDPRQRRYSLVLSARF
jgi:outer membrane receptor protein involved in Fe transport